MFTPPLSATFLILSGAVIGMVLGAVTGFVAPLLLRLKIRLQTMVMDCILGAIAFPVAFQAVLFLPWQNTISYHSGDPLVTSTMKHYQHPDAVAFAAAILLPTLYELHRFKNKARIAR